MRQVPTRQIIPGISLDASGLATVDGPTGKLLIELAFELESHTHHPVDVQHVLAAIILAVQRGELAPGQPFPPTDMQLCGLLVRHLEELFARHGGRVARED